MEQQDWITKIANVSNESDCLTLRQDILASGYRNLKEIIDSVTERITHFEEESETDSLYRMITQTEAVIPDPGGISPAWQSIWNQLKEIVRHKEEALRVIPGPERDGEWQVILDNPYTNDDVVCYPHLSFMDAVMLYSRFRAEMNGNEYIRLQKIVNYVMAIADQQVVKKGQFLQI